MEWVKQKIPTKPFPSGNGDSLLLWPPSSSMKTSTLSVSLLPQRSVLKTTQAGPNSIFTQRSKLYSSQEKDSASDTDSWDVFWLDLTQSLLYSNVQTLFVSRTGFWFCHRFLRRFLVLPNSVFKSRKGQVRSDLRRLKNRLPILTTILETFFGWT